MTVLHEMDTNSDGHLDLQELLKDMDQWSDPEDTDRRELDGRKEVETAKFQVADANGDGKLDVKELPSLFYPETHDGILAITVQATIKQKDQNGDGMLTITEFFEGASIPGESLDVTEDEQRDFSHLDIDHNGALDANELKAWESGRFLTETAMHKLFEIADRDSDMHVTAKELDDAREKIAGNDAQYHLMEWVEHFEL